MTDKKPRPKLFDLLTKADKKILTKVHGQSDRPREARIAEMAERFKVGGRTVLRWWTEMGLTNKVARPDTLKDAFTRKLGDKQYLLITSAQNATPIHKEAFANMEAYAKFLDGDIHVIPFRYKNPTSVHQDKPEDWWSPALIKYLDLARHKVSKFLEILSDVKTQPTAAYPLRGMEGVTGSASSIIGHPKMQLHTLPVLEGKHKKVLYSTGAITVQNYTDSLAGKKGEFHHTFGFIIVEIDGDDFHVRQVPIADDGSFIDLVFEVKNQKVSVVESCEAIVLGDIHWGDHDDKKMDASMILSNTVVPEFIVLHDLFNGHSINHHEANNPILKYEAIKRNRHLLAEEIEEMLNFLHYFTQETPDSQVVVVKSNHDDFLDKYIVGQDWKKDVVNSEMYAKCMSLALSGKAPRGLIPAFIEEEFGEMVTCLDRDDSFRPGSWEYAQHGDHGTNGSRGTIDQYARQSTKCIIGHGHHAERVGGAIMVGTSTKLRVGYNRGASNWIHADAIVHHNEKAQLIIYNHKYRFTTLFEKFNALIYG